MRRERERQFSRERGHAGRTSLALAPGHSIVDAHGTGAAAGALSVLWAIAISLDKTPFSATLPA
jgi:hypothetical protein